MPNSKVIHHRRRALSDPLALALLPPLNESAGERESRIRAERDARKRSDRIDEQICLERTERKQDQPDVNVLLLGQSESGKSTTLKQFQLLHSPSAFHAERIAWRMVIYLNLVRSVRKILEAISPEADSLDDHDDDSTETALLVISSTGRPPSAIHCTRVTNYESYGQRLAPLAALEEKLTQRLSSPEECETDSYQYQGTSSTWENYGNEFPGSETFITSGRARRPAPTITIPQPPFSSSDACQPVSNKAILNNSASLRCARREISVRASNNWKKSFGLGSKSISPKSAHSGEIEGWWEDPDDPAHVLNACAGAMLDLWCDPKVTRCLAEKCLRLEESSGFYLNEIPRITAKKYIPTDADILKARLKTVGVVEHTFSVTTGSSRGMEWRIYDVGGSRNQRQAWAPYFEDVNAIIFLAPISAFDQVLAEDPRINRLEDSLLLWKAVVSNNLLANVSIVLFLNKCDLLQAKLEAGVKLNRHMVSYGDRPNDYESVSKYFRNKFGALQHTFTPNKERELYIHLTTVTDTRRTKMIIASVRDIIIKGNLRDMRLV